MTTVRNLRVLSLGFLLLVPWAVGGFPGAAPSRAAEREPRRLVHPCGQMISLSDERCEAACGCMATGSCAPAPSCEAPVGCTTTCVSGKRGLLCSDDLRQLMTKLDCAFQKIFVCKSCPPCAPSCTAASGCHARPVACGCEAAPACGGEAVPACGCAPACLPPVPPPPSDEDSLKKQENPFRDDTVHPPAGQPPQPRPAAHTHSVAEHRGARGEKARQPLLPALFVSQPVGATPVQAP